MSDVEVSYPESDHVALKIDKLKIDEGESVLITGKSVLENLHLLI